MAEESKWKRLLKDYGARKAGVTAFNTATPMSPGGYKMKNSTQRGGVRKKTPSSLEEDKYFGGINPDIILGKSGKGNPKTVNPYRKPKDTVGNNPNRGIGTSKASLSGMTGKGRLRPEVKKKKSAIEEAYTLGTGNQTPKKKAPATAAQAAPKAAAPAAVKRPAFKGNWTGAAATEMQKRGGAKIKRPNLLSLFRKKK